MNRKRHKVVLGSFWHLGILLLLGVFDFFMNGSIPSLIGASILLIFLILTSVFSSDLNNRVFGGLLLIVAIWGIAELIISNKLLHLDKLIIYLVLIGVSFALLANKHDSFIAKIKGNKLYSSLVSIGIIGALLISLFKQKEIDIIETSIIVAAVILGITILLPEK